MQRPREYIDAKLLCDLPTRFGRCAKHGDAATDLPAKPLFSLHAPKASTPWECPEAAGIGKRLEAADDDGCDGISVVVGTARCAVSESPLGLTLGAERCRSLFRLAP